MSFAYEPEAWREVYIMLGGAVAALAGLLFVALSIKIDVIRQVPRWRTRAFGNIFAFVGLLIESALVMMPQSSALLALELIVLNAFLLLFVPVRAIVDLYRQHAPIPMPRMLAGMVLWSLGALGGLSLLIGAGGGMYLVAASFLGLIWLGVLNAWSFITVDDVPVREPGSV
ncbi:hypothetical protein [Pseudaminobacter soli (ex Li et al. 2025)]|uniref:Modulator of FtsH protease n=1 Tax=Pseudaminobacter soli (ex Li et al. 2025) TaxID=1295366 RepID=A0A2P7SFN4_9HYPH|nr:hypothetical protein [Mesorhizobium soli]PSJ61195.1 hypothetical protein C7I85_08900 [Mesorhizobium soli]